MAAMTHIGGYKLIRQLGEGGMGSVYLASSPDHESPLAIKLIRPEVLSNSGIVKRFHREITLCKQFDHPYVIKIYDGGVDSESSTPFLVMECLQGRSLMDVIRKGPLKPKPAVKIFIHLAEALAYVHPLGIIHRDIKPDNVFIASLERTILLDFGLAYIDASTRLSATRDCVGTLPLMSPEQLRSEVPTEASDIYNLGMTMYYALTRKGPYTMNDIALISAGREVNEPKTPSDLMPEVPSALSDIIMKCIELDKESRYSDAEVLRADLKALQNGGPIGASEEKSKKPVKSRRSAGKSGPVKAAEVAVGKKKKCHGSPVAKSASGKDISRKNAVRKGSGKNDSNNPSHETAKSSISPKTVLIFIVLILIGGSGLYLLTSHPGVSADGPWVSINNSADSLVKETTELNLSTYDGEQIVAWMRSIDDLFQSVGTFRKSHGSLIQKLNFTSTNRQIRAILKDHPLSLYISGRIEEQEGRNIKAATCYRNAASPLLWDMFDKSATCRKSNPLATWVLSRITKTLAQTDEVRVAPCNDKENVLWRDFWMNLPAKETLSEEVYFLRLWLFLSSGLSSLDKNSSTLERSLINPALSLVLHSERNQTLPKNCQSFLSALFKSSGRKVPAIYELTFDPQKEVRKIDREYFLHIDAIIITEEQHSKMKRLMTSYHLPHWLMLGQILTRRESAWSDLSEVFGRMNIIEQDMVSPKLKNRTIDTNYEQLRLMRARMASYNEETKLDTRLLSEFSTFSQAIGGGDALSKSLTDEKILLLKRLGLLYGEDKFFFEFADALSSYDKDQPDKLVKSVVKVIKNLLSDVRYPLSIRVLKHKIGMIQFSVFWLGKRLVKEWSGPSDMTALNHIKPVLADLKKAWNKAVIDEAAGQKNLDLSRPLDSLYHVETVISFILRLHTDGVTKKDCSVVKKILPGGDLMETSFLWLRKKELRPPAPPTPWLPPDPVPWTPPKSAPWIPSKSAPWIPSKR